jgi:hypothetical protein
MKTIFRNRIAQLLFTLIITFSPIMAFGQGLYNKKTEPTPIVEEKTGVFLRAESTENKETDDGKEGDRGNPLKIMEEDMPLSDGLYLLLLAALGYGLFIRKKEQKQRYNLMRMKGSFAP